MEGHGETQQQHRPNRLSKSSSKSCRVSVLVLIFPMAPHGPPCCELSSYFTVAGTVMSMPAFFSVAANAVAFVITALPSAMAFGSASFASAY